MAAGQVNARDYIFMIGETPNSTFTKIEGLTSWELDPSENEETADTTDFDSDGDYSQHIMQRGATLEVEGKKHIDESDAGEGAPGQLLVEEYGTRKGVASVVVLRFRHKTEESWVEWDCTITLGSRGGETNDKDSWGATFSRNGAAREVDVTP